ncbi:hypothetical protein RJK31_004432 [Salmonella enterica]|nr:hypothetical protein [Salmonella enterica]EFB0088236.1 hypothetical protein [Salmonella enterica]EFR3658191.1 hypothetical protein [Salmonella enterica]EHY0218380.1 hypothetical protein [Salmonella enterica]EIE7706049.1 hypothetical protein [Salmonella enterica]
MRTKKDFLRQLRVVGEENLLNRLVKHIGRNLSDDESIRLYAVAEHRRAEIVFEHHIDIPDGTTRHRV